MQQQQQSLPAGNKKSDGSGQQQQQEQQEQEQSNEQKQKLVNVNVIKINTNDDDDDDDDNNNRGNNKSFYYKNKSKKGKVYISTNSNEASEELLKFEPVEYDASIDPTNPEQFNSKTYKVETRYIKVNPSGAFIKQDPYLPEYSEIFSNSNNTFKNEKTVEDEESKDSEEGLPLPVTTSRSPRDTTNDKFNFAVYGLIWLIILGFIFFGNSSCSMNMAGSNQQSQSQSQNQISHISIEVPSSGADASHSDGESVKINIDLN